MDHGSLSLDVILEQNVEEDNSEFLGALLSDLCKSQSLPDSPWEVSRT